MNLQYHTMHIGPGQNYNTYVYVHFSEVHIVRIKIMLLGNINKLNQPKYETFYYYA